MVRVQARKADKLFRHARHSRPLSSTHRLALPWQSGSASEIYQGSSDPRKRVGSSTKKGSLLFLTSRRKERVSSKIGKFVDRIYAVLALVVKQPAGWLAGLAATACAKTSSHSPSPSETALPRFRFEVSPHSILSKSSLTLYCFEDAEQFTIPNATR